MPQRRGAFTSCFWDECTWGISLSGVLRLGGCLLALPLTPLGREVSGNLKWPFCLRSPPAWPARVPQATNGANSILACALGCRDAPERWDWVAGPPEGPGRGEVSGQTRSRETWGTFSTSPGWVGLPRRGRDSTCPRRGRGSGRVGTSANPRRGGVPGVGPIHRSRWGISSHQGVGTHRSKARLGGAGPAAAALAAVATV